MCDCLPYTYDYIVSSSPEPKNICKQMLLAFCASVPHAESWSRWERVGEGFLNTRPLLLLLLLLFFYTVCTCTCRNVTRSLSLYVYCRTLDNSYVRYPNAIRVFKNQEPMLKSCQCTICSFRVNTRVFCLKQWITQFFHREPFQSLVKIII